MKISRSMRIFLKMKVLTLTKWIVWTEYYKLSSFKEKLAIAILCATAFSSLSIFSDVLAGSTIRWVDVCAYVVALSALAGLIGLCLRIRSRFQNLA